MKLAVVVGQLVATVKCKGFDQGRLLLVDEIDTKGKQKGAIQVAADQIGAGNGEWVLVVEGSSARKTTQLEAPVDMSVIGIVDEVVLNSKVVYHK